MSRIRSLARWFPLAALVPLLALAPVAARAQVEKPVFKMGLVLNGAKDRHFDGDVLNAATAAFVESKRFTMVERSQLNAVLTEKDFQEFIGGQVKQKLTTVLGLDYLGVVDYTSDKVTGLDNVKRPRLIINVKVIDVGTAAIFATLESARPDLLSVPENPRDAGLALFKSVREAFPPLGYVVQVEGKKVMVDLGSEAGVKDGDVLEVVREGKQIVHPVSGKLLPAAMEVIGELKVISSSPAMSSCKVKSSKGGEIAVVNLVRLKKENSAWKSLLLKVPLARNMVNSVSKNNGK